MVRFPLPLVTEVMVIHGALSLAVHEQFEVVKTVNDEVPPAGPKISAAVADGVGAGRCGGAAAAGGGNRDGSIGCGPGVCKGDAVDLDADTDHLGAARGVFEGLGLAVLEERGGADLGRALAIAAGAAHGPGDLVDVHEDAVDAEDDGLTDLRVRGGPANLGLDGAVAHVHVFHRVVAVAGPVVDGKSDGVETPLEGVARNDALRRVRTPGVVGGRNALATAIGRPIDLPAVARDVALRDRTVEGHGLVVQRQRRADREVGRH